MSETNQQPDQRFVVAAQSDFSPSRVSARALVDEAAFAVQQFKMAQAGQGSAVGDAQGRAGRAVEAVARRSDTLQVLTNAGLDAQSAKADLAAGRTDRLAYAFQTPPLSERHNYGPPPSAEPTAVTHVRNERGAIPRSLRRA